MKDVKDLEVNNWDEIFNTKQFWQEYFDGDLESNVLLKHFKMTEEEYDELDEIIDLELEIPFPQNYSLVLSHSLGWTYEADLELKFPQESNSFDNITLGWDDQAHWHPDFFRIEEFQNIIKYLEAKELPGLKCDPKFVPLLLRKFTPLSSENSDAVSLLTREIIKKMGLFTKAETEKLAKLREEYPVEDFRWAFNPEFGWVQQGEDGYSLRHEITHEEEESTESIEKRKLFFQEVRKFFQALYQEMGISDPA